MNAIHRFYSVLKRKDKNNERYYYSIVVIDENHTELEYISNLNNKNATGAEQFKTIAESAKQDGYSKLVIKIFTTYGSKADASKEAISTTTIPLNEQIVKKNNSKEVADSIDSAFSVFGGFKGFLAERDIASAQAIEVKQRDLEIRFLEKELELVKNEHASMLAKLGTLEIENKRYEQENFDMQRKSGILNIITGFNSL